MGGLPREEKKENAEGAPPVDVSAEGTLVWLRRPNGSWWPSIVVSPQDVPEACAAPTRCRATTPIMLLGRRRDGPTFIDWCNLDRCKRVKPFRCGELDFEQRITNAIALAAASNSSTWNYNKGRYARMEDAIIQALDIERARALDPATKAYLHGGTTPTIQLPDNGQLKDDAPMLPSTATEPPPPLLPAPPGRRKRKTPYDSEDDAPKGSRRMRDLSDIGSKTTVPPTDISHADVVSVSKYDNLPNVGQVKPSVQPHAATKRKHAAMHQDQPSGIPRKKDKSRALSELCNGDMWNGSRSNGHKADQHLSAVATCSSGSSGTSTLDTSLDMTSCHHIPAFKTDQPKGTEISCMTRLLGGDFSHANGFLETPLAAQSILEPDHLQRYQPCGSTKSPWKKQTNDFSRAEKCDRKNIKTRTISSVDQEGNRPRDSNEHGRHKTKTLNQKSPRDEVVLLEKRLDKHSLNKPAGCDTKMHLALIPTDMDCVGAVQRHRSKCKRDPEESSETMSNCSNCESGSVSSLVFELPLQVLPPEKEVLDLERYHAVKPIKTMHLNSTLYDVEMSVLGSCNTGRRVPLVSLMSKWNRRPVVGYPVSVEVCDDVFGHPLSSRDGQHPATSSVGRTIPKRKGETEDLQCLVSSPPQACRAKPKSRSRKTLEKEVDKLWQPHTKKPASGARKMRRLSSFASGQRDGSDRKSAVGKVSGAAIACIPLRVVFSRINEALSFPVK